MTRAAIIVTLRGTPEQLRGVLGYCASTGVLASPATKVGYEPNKYTDTVTGGDIVRLVRMMCEKDGLGPYDSRPQIDIEAIMNRF